MDFDLITPMEPSSERLSSIELRSLGFFSVPEGTLSRLAEAAFDRLSFTFSEEHLLALAAIVNDSTNSANDRMVARWLLENAVISAKGELPLCQDTGTAQVFAWKPSGAMTAGDDESELAEGISKTYTTRNLRYSTTIPSSLFEESDPGDNSPPQIMIASVPNGAAAFGSAPAYRFLFCAKGGGSSNKTSLTQATKAILTDKAFEAFLRTQIAALGTAACPPYSIAVVVGGISPEQNLLALKLATAGYFDERLPGWDYRVLGSEPLRDEGWERHALEIARETGLGAQFGGKCLALSARVLRLPRHGASCPVSVGVSCAAHRNLLAYIDAKGVWLERTVSDPLSLEAVRTALAIDESSRDVMSARPIAIDLDQGIPKVRELLSGIEPGSPALLSGKLLVARDAAHARWRALIVDGKPLPEYLTRYGIAYAGPSNTPEGRVSGSIGPTTAGRMDEYAEDLMSRGAALLTLAKGNRSETWRAACAKYGATYLGTPGGIAALIADRHITSSEIVDYPELGMEAVRLITVIDLPAFVLINDRGEDFYRTVSGGKK
ncbi:MAG TPA: fumarate hydratase [Treponemataceae bacterium]|nr:fumarate hydratase [Treponemataceae bacterium]